MLHVKKDKIEKSKLIQKKTLVSQKFLIKLNIINVILNLRNELYGKKNFKCHFNYFK